GRVPRRQRAGDDPAVVERDVEVVEGVDGPPPGVGGVVGGRGGGPVRQVGAVGHGDVAATRVPTRRVPGPQLDESVVVEAEPGFLGQLAGGSGADGLAGVDVPAGQRPVALVRGPATADQQDVLQAVSVGGDGDDVGGQADRLVRHAVSPISRCGGGGGGGAVWRPCRPLTGRAGARTRRLPTLRA